MICYHQEIDSLIGFCGVKGEQHQCLDNFVVEIGGGEEGYNRIVQAFDEYQIGCYGRAILTLSILVYPNFQFL